MATYYQSRPEDTDPTVISPQQNVSTSDIFSTSPHTTFSHRGSIGNMSSNGEKSSTQMDEDDFAAFQQSLISASRVPSLSPPYLSSNGYSSNSAQGHSPHSFSSASPSSNYSNTGMGATDDFLFNNSFGQDELDRLLYQEPGLMLGSAGDGGVKMEGLAQGQAAEEPVFHLPKDWSFQYNQSQQLQPTYQQSQAFTNTFTYPDLTSPKTTQTLFNQNNFPTQLQSRAPQSQQLPLQTEGDLRKAAEVANQARAAATRELEEVRRQQMLQAEQIQALQRAQHAPQPSSLLQTIPPSWMNQPLPAQQPPPRGWGEIIPPTLPATQANLPKPVPAAAPRKGRPPKSAQPVPSGDSTSPPDVPEGKHNKTERRYRQKVQVAQAELRDAVPALRVHYGTSTPEQKATTDYRAADGTVDGLGEVSRPNASAKATILNGARLYIELLQSRVAGMQRMVDELEAYRLAVGGRADLDRWRSEFATKENIRAAEAEDRMKKEVVEMDESESESEDEAPKKRKRGPVPGAAAAKKKKANAESGGNGVRVFAAFAMSFSLVPSASTLLRHQPAGDISPGHVLSGAATPTQVISRLPLITAEHAYRALVRVLPAAVVPTPGIMVDWTWRLLVAAVLVLVLGPIIRSWTKTDEDGPAGDIVEAGKDAVKLSMGIRGEEDEEWVEYAAKVLGKVVEPTTLARYHLAIRLRRTASTPYALALSALTQPATPLLRSPSATWQQARSILSAEDPAPLQAVLALPFEEAQHSLTLLPTTSSPIAAIAEQITLVHLNDLYSRLFTRLVESTISRTSLPISIHALLENLSAKPVKADLSTFDQEIRDTVRGVSKGTAVHALGLVLIGLWGVFSGPAPSAQASLASALAGEEINGGGAGLQSVSAMLDLLYPGAAQSVSSEDRLRLSALPQNALALDKLALVCIGYVRLLYTCGGRPATRAARAEKAKVVGRATADLRLVISETKFVGLDTGAGMDAEEDLETGSEDGDQEEGEEKTGKMDSEVARFVEAKERLVGVLSVIGRRAAGRVEASEDSGLDVELDEL